MPQAGSSDPNRDGLSAHDPRGAVRGTTASLPPPSRPKAGKIDRGEILRGPDDPVINQDVTVATLEPRQRPLTLIERVHQGRDDDVTERGTRRIPAQTPLIARHRGRTRTPASTPLVTFSVRPYVPSVRAPRTARGLLARQIRLIGMAPLPLCAAPSAATPTPPGNTAEPAVFAASYSIGSAVMMSTSTMLTPSAGAASTQVIGAHATPTAYWCC